MLNYIPLFTAQQQNQYHIGNTTYKQRIAKLKRLKKAVSVTYRKALQEALYADFKKPATEADLTEIYPVVGEIKHVIAHLKQWMKDQHVGTPLALLGSSSYIKYEPKGVCLLISPWNFPVNLTLGPLISAIAAGNTVIIKPSEMTPNTSQVLGDIISDLFPENEIALVQGEVETASALLQLPFNHIFFTGAPSIGKVVMKAAAQHLSSVTLELGGKSPTIVDETAKIASSARKIVWGKFVNNGQVCVAPDYILVQENAKEKLIAALIKEIKAFYGANAAHSDSYCRIVNNRHFNRLNDHLNDALEQNATLVYGGERNAETNYIAPTLLTNIPEEATLLKDEIFGPILPIISYTTTEEAIAYVNKGEKPLALYIFSESDKTINTILNNTRAGGSCINHNVIQYANHNLPFGGSNNSGIGKSHGHFGFLEFSNMRSVVKQHIPGASEFLFPPYTSLKERLAKITVKWL